MKFYDFIANFKFECNKYLKINEQYQNETQQDINEIIEKIEYMKSIAGRPFPSLITGSISIAAFIATFFCLIFQTKLWIIFSSVFAIFTPIAIINEKLEEEHKKEIEKTEELLRSLYDEKHRYIVAKRHLLSLINDIPTCCNYYAYVMNNTEIPITINIKDVLNSFCMLSTFLDKFYTNELDSFLRLSTNEKIINEKLTKVRDKILIARNNQQENYNFSSYQPKRRRNITSKSNLL